MATFADDPQPNSDAHPETRTRTALRDRRTLARRVPRLSLSARDLVPWTGSLFGRAGGIFMVVLCFFALTIAGIERLWSGTYGKYMALARDRFSALNDMPLSRLSGQERIDAALAVVPLVTHSGNAILLVSTSVVAIGALLLSTTAILRRRLGRSTEYSLESSRDRAERGVSNRPSVSVGNGAISRFRPSRWIMRSALAGFLSGVAVQCLWLLVFLPNSLYEGRFLDDLQPATLSQQIQVNGARLALDQALVSYRISAGGGLVVAVLSLLVSALDLRWSTQPSGPSRVTGVAPDTAGEVARDRGQ